MSDSRRRWARAAVMGIAVATLGLGLVACGGDDDDGGGGGAKIALLLPETKTTTRAMTGRSSRRP
jgi:D-xylose transport system substrate-binding protein